MTERLLKVLPLGVFGALIAALAATPGVAQEPIPLTPPGQNVPRLAEPEPLPLPVPGQPVPGQPAQPANPAAGQPQGDGIEVLAKGPVHEAFAATAEPPAASPTVPKQPPDPIEELPPDQKPEGDNVQWIPGYWHWDEENARFIWVSGFWRQPPPGRVWVPGAWRQVTGGWQWVGGFWQPVNPLPQQNQNLAQVQPEIEYLPPPPDPLETGPSVPAPGASYFYSPGSWVWRGRYVWRPGVWVEYRPDWVWVPARYYWTPAGYVYSEGYWDYPLARRGVLFAPVAFAQPLYVQPAFVYTPVYVVSEPCMVGALFVRRGYGGYYFGDYFGPTYATGGYRAWCGVYTRSGFSIGFGVGRSWGYDPLWSYYSVTYRSTPAWHRGVGDLYGGRYRGDIMRPPTTLVQQNTTINKITNVNVNNVTNNITVVNGAPVVNNKNVSNVAMVAPLKVAPDLQKAKYTAVSADARRTEAVAARQLRDVGAQRTKLETAVAKQPAAAPPVAGQPHPPAQPKSIKLDVPKTAVARAHVQDEKLAPPPAPHHAAPGAKVDPHPKVDPKQPFSPKLDPQPKVDPRPMVQPKVDPKLPVQPKFDPQPKVDPKLPVNPMGNPQPKIDPKLPVVPKFDPKQPGNPVPKFDPRPPGPRPMPKAEPHKPAPKEKPLASAPPVAPHVQPPPVRPHQSLYTPPAPPPQPYRPAAVAPPVQPQRFVAPPAQPPKIVQQPRIAPPQPRPAVTLPRVQPRVVQPPKAQPPVHQPRARPAPPGKPRVKARRDKDEE